MPTRIIRGMKFYHNFHQSSPLFNVQAYLSILNIVQQAVQRGVTNVFETTNTGLKKEISKSSLSEISPNYTSMNRGTSRILLFFFLLLDNIKSEYENFFKNLFSTG
jgi:hypothetical protein